MLYPERQQPFSMKIFENPPANYRDVPFWAWNTAVTEEDIDFCLSVLKEMGMGGGFIHSRTGLDIPYLGKRFMDLVAYAHKKAGKLGLKTWLYDEDRWPSGFAGGYVTSNQAYRARYLVWTLKEYKEGEIPEESEKGSTAKAVRSSRRRLLGVYRVEAENGYLKGYERLGMEDGGGEKTGEDLGEATEDGLEKGRQSLVWRAYLEVCGDNPWFNNQSYVDTLNPEAVKAFIESTYEPYRQLAGGEFGKEIPGIFTDEPQFTPMEQAGSTESREEVILPFTDRLPRIFRETYGFDLLDRLPELFYDREEAYSRARYCYHELVSRLFSESYCRQIGQWCQENHIALTGHLMKEPLLASQTAFVGETMRAYAGFQIPGMDLLCDRREFTTAKQVQSVVRQYGREAMISELYGVTNWSFDFRGHKLQGDWQAALGVTVRAPHLAWTSMEGEAKRDYPASIFYQSPWYREYKLIEDYFARIAVLMSRGEGMAKIGVIHPVETCWLLWGTREKTKGMLKELDEKFVGLTDWLLGNCLDFDFISEGLLPELYKGSRKKKCRIGKMCYEAILVPFMETVKGTTVEMLKEYEKEGGKVIFLEKIPGCVDGIQSDKAKELKTDSNVISHWGIRLLEELKEYRELELFYGAYERAEDLLCRMQKEGEERYLFIAHKYNPEKKDLVQKKRLTVRLKGVWSCTRLNPMDGTCVGLKHCRYTKQETEFSVDWYEHDSLLLMMKPGGKEEECLREPGDEAEKDGGERREMPVPSRCPITLQEPNVLVLDMPKYSFDGQPWQEPEEILRLDNKLRKMLGYPLRTEAWAQPWAAKQQAQGEGAGLGEKAGFGWKEGLGEKAGFGWKAGLGEKAGFGWKAGLEKETGYYKKARCLELCYEIWSLTEVENVEAGLEQPEECTLYWNGEKKSREETGWYVDRKIKTLSLGRLKAGRNELRIVRSFHEGANLEAVYLLGDFGVCVRGRRAVVTEPVRELDFGDWTVQGLPFYGGNVVYHLETKGDGKEAEIEISRFTTPLVTVDMEGEKKGSIAFSPYRLKLGVIPEGRHGIHITAFGNRVNTFGALHNCDMEDNTSAPDYWRTKGCKWSYEYCLRPSGILKTPVLRKII